MNRNSIKPNDAPRSIRFFGPPWDVPTGPASGLFTRYYQQASSGNFIALGDYLQAPSNHGVFQVYTPDSVVSLGDVFAAVDSALGNTITTAHSYNSINDFDRWTIGVSNDPYTGPPLPALGCAECLSFIGLRPSSSFIIA